MTAPLTRLKMVCVKFLRVLKQFLKLMIKLSLVCQLLQVITGVYEFQQALNAETGTTKQVLVTKTRIVYDTVPVYETRQEEYVITPAVPAVPAYDRPYWQERAKYSNESRNRYRTCDWNTSTCQCTWPNTWQNISNKPSSVNSNGKTAKACTTDFKCFRNGTSQFLLFQVNQL